MVQIGLGVLTEPPSQHPLRTSTVGVVLLVWELNLTKWQLQARVLFVNWQLTHPMQQHQ